MLLELTNISKHYTKGSIEVPALREISLSVNAGEYVAIMGPSGSGKTTLMNIIGCLDRPSQGAYRLSGQSILDCTENQLSDLRLRTIGFVFQNFYLLPRLSALENVALPLSYAGVPRLERLEIARTALVRVGLADRVDFLPAQLSGGQCQRVAIARAMVNRPRILLADEPTGSLDTESGAQIMALFEALNQEGVTILMITHEQEVAEHAKIIYRIKDGRFVHRGRLTAHGAGESGPSGPSGSEPPDSSQPDLTGPGTGGPGPSGTQPPGSSQPELTGPGIGGPGPSDAQPPGSPRSDSPDFRPSGPGLSGPGPSDTAFAKAHVVKPPSQAHFGKIDGMPAETGHAGDKSLSAAEKKPPGGTRFRAPHAAGNPGGMAPQRSQINRQTKRSAAFGSARPFGTAAKELPAETKGQAIFSGKAGQSLRTGRTKPRRAKKPAGRHFSDSKPSPLKPLPPVPASSPKAPLITDPSLILDLDPPASPGPLRADMPAVSSNAPAPEGPPFFEESIRPAEAGIPPGKSPMPKPPEPSAPPAYPDPKKPRKPNNLRIRPPADGVLSRFHQKKEKKARETGEFSAPIKTDIQFDPSAWVRGHREEGM